MNQNNVTLRKILMICGIWSFAWQVTHAQTLLDGFMMNKKEFCAAVNYQQEKWDEYWEGTLLRKNGNIGTFSRQSVNPMLVYGVFNRVNVLIGTSYVWTAATGGQLAGAQGIQDGIIGVKANVWKQKIGKLEVDAFASGSFSTPLSNYLSDYAPFSLGLGCQEIALRGIVDVHLPESVYARVAAAQLWRTYTTVERNYYYADKGYYTNIMDVPNAYQLVATVGSWFFKKHLHVDASYATVKCTSGDDIRRQNAPQPTNKMIADQYQIFAQYYFHKPKGLGVTATYFGTLSGRNVGKTTGFNAGITYQFNHK